MAAQHLDTIVAGLQDVNPAVGLGDVEFAVEPTADALGLHADFEHFRFSGGDEGRQSEGNQDSFH